MEQQYGLYLVTLDFVELQTYTCEFQLKDQIPEFFRNTEILNSFKINKVKTKPIPLFLPPEERCQCERAIRSTYSFYKVYV